MPVCRSSGSRPGRPAARSRLWRSCVPLPSCTSGPWLFSSYLSRPRLSQQYVIFADCPLAQTVVGVDRYTRCSVALSSSNRLLQSCLKKKGKRTRRQSHLWAFDISPEDAAGIIRNALCVPLSEQFLWRRPEDSFAGWLRAVESLDVFVLRTSEVEVEEMRGFSISSGGIPIIVVNALDWPRGQVFTLLHELAHLTLREGGLCDLLEPDSAAIRAVEAWCNAVAAATLMPRDEFLDNDVIGPPGEREWDDDVLVQLSNRWGVSREAVLRRLVTLGRASYAFYRLKREEYLVAYAAYRDEERLRRRQSGGGPPPYRMAVRDRGKPYVRLVLDAYQRDLISLSSVSNLLNLKLKHLSALEHEVGA